MKATSWLSTWDTTRSFLVWEYDQQMYKRRNEIERLFRRQYRRIFSRFDKLDAYSSGSSPSHSSTTHFVV